MNLTHAELQQRIDDRVSVTRQLVVATKSLVLGHFDPDPQYIVRDVLNSQSIYWHEPNGQPVLVVEQDPDSAIDRIAKHVSWKAATCQAVAELVANGILFISEPGNWRQVKPVHIRYTLAVGPSSSVGNSLDFTRFFLPLPEKLREPITSTCRSADTLSDPDLYITALDIAGMDGNVKEAVMEASACFRQELYTPCLVMLGKASEGAWIECGLALLEALEKADGNSHDKERDTLLGQRGVMEKAAQVLDLFKHQQLQNIRQTSSVRKTDMEYIAVWSDAVRNSRNVLHYGVAPSLPNGYEKTAALLISAVTHLRPLYRVREAALAEVART